MPPTLHFALGFSDTGPRAAESLKQKILWPPSDMQALTASEILNLRAKNALHVASTSLIP